VLAGTPPSIESLIPQLDPFEVTIESLLGGLAGSERGRPSDPVAGRRFPGPESW
jgi:hypothetical protein